METFVAVLIEFMQLVQIVHDLFRLGKIQPRHGHDFFLTKDGFFKHLMQAVFVLNVVNDMVLVRKPVIVGCAKIVCNIMGHDAYFFGYTGNRCAVVLYQTAGEA